MIVHNIKVYPSKIHLPKKNQLAWKIAEIANDNVKLNKDSVEMVINRMIDNASVAIASLNRKAVITSREMAMKHPRNNGATLFGINSKKKFDFIFQVDSDDQFFSKDFKKLWRLKNNDSLILGFRKKRYDSFHRLIITRLLKFLNLILFRKFVPDANIPYRLIGYNFLKKNFKFLKPGSFAPNILISIKAAKDKKIKNYLKEIIN